MHVNMWWVHSLEGTTEEPLRKKKSSGSGQKTENTAVGILCSDHTTPSIRKSRHYLRRKAVIDIVRSRTKVTELYCHTAFQWSK
jgi:hypothetical protein